MSNQMKNGDMPAMPLTGDAYTDFSGHLNKDNGYEPECLGMTKREMIAMHLMAGLLSDFKMNGTFQFFAESSVSAADALLAALEKTK